MWYWDGNSAGTEPGVTSDHPPEDPPPFPRSKTRPRSREQELQRPGAEFKLYTEKSNRDFLFPVGVNFHKEGYIPKSERSDTTLLLYMYVEM